MLGTKATVHLHEDDLELYARGRLEPELLPVIENHLLACETCRKSLADCLRQGLALQLTHRTQTDRTQKRLEPRFNTDGEATLQELHPLSTERHKVKIVNVSKNGLGISSPIAIFPGTIVQLRINENVEIANVRYCSASRDDAFQIGLQLHSES
jgi:PilZ domain